MTGNYPLWIEELPKKWLVLLLVAWFTFITLLLFSIILLFLYCFIAYSWSCHCFYSTVHSYSHLNVDNSCSLAQHLIEKGQWVNYRYNNNPPTLWKHWLKFCDTKILKDHLPPLEEDQTIISFYHYFIGKCSWSDQHWNVWPCCTKAWQEKGNDDNTNKW